MTGCQLIIGLRPARLVQNLIRRTVALHQLLLVSNIVRGARKSHWAMKVCLVFDTGGLTVNSVRAPGPAEMAFCHATQSYLLRIFQVLHIFHFLSDQPDELSFRSRDDVFNSAVVVIRLKLAHLSEEVDHLDFWSNLFDCNLVGKVEFWLAIWLANWPDVQETLRGIW